MSPRGGGGWSQKLLAGWRATVETLTGQGEAAAHRPGTPHRYPSQQPAKARMAATPDADLTHSYLAGRPVSSDNSKFQ